jgi:hypothetical protein
VPLKAKILRKKGFHIGMQGFYSSKKKRKQFTEVIMFYRPYSASKG